MVERGCAVLRGDRSDGKRERWLLFALMVLERARRGGRAVGDCCRRDRDLVVLAGALVPQRNLLQKSGHLNS